MSLYLHLDFPWLRPGDPRRGLGAASIVATVRDRTTARAELLTYPLGKNLEPDPEQIIADVMAQSAGHSRVDLGIGAYIWCEDLVQKVLRGLRKANFKGRIILGGPQISYSGPGLENLYPEVDLFVRGYGEDVVAALISAPDNDLPKGVHAAGTPDRCAVAQVDFDTLPSPLLAGLVPNDTGGGRRVARWETQRGCPHRCTFCQHREAGGRLTRRDLNRKRLEHEVEHLIADQVTDLSILDPVFNSGPNALWVLKLLKAKGYTGRLSLQCRPEGLKGSFLDTLAGLNVTLEVGLQTIHRAEGQAVQRMHSQKQIEGVIKMLKARNIRHMISIIYGLPCQTLDSFLKTIDVCLCAGVDQLRAFPLMLLRGTKMSDDREKWGLRESNDRIPVVIESHTFNHEEWIVMDQVSAALRKTEGHHPPKALLVLAETQSCSL